MGRVDPPVLLSVHEALAYADTLAFLGGQLQTGAITLTDAVTVALGAAPGDSVTLTETLEKLIAI